MDRNINCPLCHIPQAWVNGNGDRFDVDCLGCGKFAVTGSASVIKFAEDLLPRLRCWARTESDAGTSVLITTEVIEEAGSRLPDPSIPEKLELALAWLARQTKTGGQKCFIFARTHPALWAYSEAELRFLLYTLSEQRLIDRTDSALGYSCHVTAEGWAKVAQSLRGGMNSNRAFVAMAFAPDLVPIYDEGIAPAIRASGYQPSRVDSEPHVERIDWKILADIRASRFVVADVTSHRNGVYFEAGYAIGIDRKVI